MARSYAFEVPVDAGFFTPLHLQPAAVWRLAFGGEGSWLRHHAVSHRRRAPCVIHRHQFEVADQWFWPEAVSLAGSGREELVRTEAERVPALRLAMRRPASRLDLLLVRPFFLFDEGAVRTTASEWEGR